MNDDDVVFDFSKKPDPKCRHCRRRKGDHKALTYNCPIQRGQFPQFKTQVYEPQLDKKANA